MNVGTPRAGCFVRSARPGVTCAGLIPLLQCSEHKAPPLHIARRKTIDRLAASATSASCCWRRDLPTVGLPRNCIGCELRCLRLAGRAHAVHGGRGPAYPIASRAPGLRIIGRCAEAANFRTKTRRRSCISPAHPIACRISGSMDLISRATLESRHDSASLRYGPPRRGPTSDDRSLATATMTFLLRGHSRCLDP
jgi:hypothetical protein